MAISVRQPDHIVPEYSLTGDLLAYLKCGLQYRMYNRANLPPSVPVQQWFGEFIHGVLEEAYSRWNDSSWVDFPDAFPWTWQTHLKPIELAIHNRLTGRGLPPPPRLLYEGLRRAEYGEAEEEQRGIASRRFEVALNAWGPHLFPLVERAEVRLRGSRPMAERARFRATRFAVTGIVDVLSSVRLREAPGNNIIIRRLRENPRIRQAMDESAEPFDIIVDYKGMRRPPQSDPAWAHQEWQLQTYAWLRRRQSDGRRVLAGVLLYINELLPSETDMNELALDVANGDTDILPGPVDLPQIAHHAPTNTAFEDVALEEERIPAADALSMPFREDRSFRLVEVDEASSSAALDHFKSVVADIEAAVQAEMHSSDARDGWATRPERRTCVACDFKYHCPEREDQPLIP